MLDRIRPDSTPAPGENPLLDEVAHGLAAGRDLESLLGRIAEITLEVAGADGAFLERVDEDTGEVEVVSARGRGGAEVGYRVPYPGSLAQKVIETGEPEFLASPVFGGRILGGELRGGCADCSGVVVPLMSEGAAVGALILLRFGERETFEPDVVRRVAPFADLAALQMRKARLAAVADRRLGEYLQSERRFHLLVSAVRDYAIFMLDPDGVIASWNEGAERITGYSEREILGRHFSLFYTDEDRNRDHPAYELSTARSIGRYAESGWRVRADGTRYRAHVLITALRSSDGSLVGFGKVTRDLSEWDALEAARESEAARYRTIYQHNPSIFLTTDDLNVVTDINEFGAAYLGYAPSELVGRPAVDIVDPRDRERFLDHVGSCLRSPGTTHRIEIRKLGRDGQLLWVRENARAVTGADGELVVLNSCEDITDRVEAEQALRRSEEQLRQVADSLREVLWVADGAFEKLTFVSPSFERIWGRSRESLYADPRVLIRSVPRECRATVVEGLERMGRERFGMEFPILKPDGERREISLRGFPVLDPAGKTRRIVGIAEDVTDRRRVEERRAFLAEAGRVLASSLDYERTLRNLADLAVSRLADWCVVDLCEDGTIRRVAVAHADPALAPVAERYQQAFPPDPEGSAGGPRVIRTGEPEMIEKIDEALIRRITRSDEQFEMLSGLGISAAMTVPLKLEDRVLGAITVLRSGGGTFDADDLQTAELLAARAALEIEKARLFREANEAKRLREDVLSVVSHDLRNPLNTIMMSAGFLGETEMAGDPAVRKQLEIISRSATQMNHLIGDLLDVAQIEGGGLVLEKERQEVRLLISEACASFQPLADGKGISLSCQVPEELPPIPVDRGRLLQVFSNLIGNAVKFTDEGGRIDVSATPDRDCIRFLVADNGSGIHAEDLPRLFDRFYQSSTTKKGGAGLGLAIVKGIVEAHGGRVEIASRPGLGTTFSFILPSDLG
jgi:PAS domain S-box-containing protein